MPPFQLYVDVPQAQVYVSFSQGGSVALSRFVSSEFAFPSQGVATATFLSQVPI